MELYLMNNDPTQTLLVPQDGGVPQYATQTSPGVNGKVTVVRRVDREVSIGHVQSEIGRIEYQDSNGVRLSLCAQGVALAMQPYSPEKLDSSWTFTGPDGRPYKWQTFIHPVLLLNDNSQTPIARYRRAKLGIVSRSRRAFLEIFPAGLNIIDLIVVTFVSFSKQQLIAETPPIAQYLST